MATHGPKVSCVIRLLPVRPGNLVQRLVRLTASMILEHLPYLATKRVVLASASPRRLELLQLVGMRPRVVTSTFEETLPKSDFENGAEYAVATSRGKALEVAQRLNCNQEHADLIIGADTVSVCLAGVFTVQIG